MNIKKLSYVLAFSLCLLAAGLLQSSAQQSQPRFLFSWQTDTYAPPGFGGKVLPSPGAVVTVSFEVMQGGKLVNLSKQTVYWYANNELVSNILGKQTLSFTAPAFPGVVDIRVQLPDYPGGLVFQSINIPVVQPEAVIESAYPGGSFAGLSARVQGVPYFFNVRSPHELSFAWEINGETPESAEDPTNLSVSLNTDAPLGAALNIGLTIQDPTGELLVASANTTLTYAR